MRPKPAPLRAKDVLFPYTEAIQAAYVAEFLPALLQPPVQPGAEFDAEAETPLLVAFE